MAPKKKNVSDVPLNIALKRERKVKPIKPPLKTPTVIRVRMRNTAASKTNRIERIITADTKLKLANEVALAQLVKPREVSPKPEPSATTSTSKKTENSEKSPVVTMKPKIVRKRKLQKKQDEETSLSDTPLVNLAFGNSSSPSEPSKPKRRRKQTLKAIQNEDTSIVWKKPKNYTTDDEQVFLTKKKKPGPRSRTMNILLPSGTTKPIEPIILSLATPVASKPVTKKPKSTIPKPQAKNKLAKFGNCDVALEPLNKTAPPVAKGKNMPRKCQQRVKSMFFSDINGVSDDAPNVTAPVNVTTPVVIPPLKRSPVKRVCKRKTLPMADGTETIDMKKSKRTVPPKSGRQRMKFETERPKAIGKKSDMESITEAAAIVEKALRTPTRPNSSNSSYSALSWTRNISTESSSVTCVTVSSNDLVSFDNKVPIVQIPCLNTNMDRLKIIEKKIERNLHNNNDSSSRSSSSSSTSESSSQSNMDVSRTELNLSTSSLTISPLKPDISSRSKTLQSHLNEMNKVVTDFYEYMTRFKDIELDESETFTEFTDILDLERELLKSCETFQSKIDAVKATPSPINSPEKSRHYESGASVHRNSDSSIYNRCSSSPELSKRVEAKGELDFVKSDARSKVDVYTVNIDVPQVSNFLDSSRPEGEGGSSDNFPHYIPSTNVNYLPFDRADDDDALSLFAESISGIESSRISTVSNFDAQDVYVPLPKPTARSWQQEKYTYKPTRISDTGSSPERPLDNSPDLQKTTEKIKKQNADSTSIFKDIDSKRKVMDPLQDAHKHCTLGNASVDKLSKPRPFAQYKPMSNVKSMLYGGHCFFFNASQCNKTHCRFPHKIVDTALLKCRLAVMSENSLIEEYLLTRNWIKLRREYGVFFLEECKRRKFTNIFFEMATDLGLGVADRDHNLVIAALETTLLHLNNISIETCSDFLLHEHNGLVMCDVLLRCMAESQNFAQFKRAFTKLAHFCEMKRRVPIDVVQKILERVCILPGEDALARGMLSLMKSTDLTVFVNTMTKSFEVQLSFIESDVHEAYLLAKKAATEALMEKFNEPPFSVSDNSKDTSRHTSPDTTNLDSLKKAQISTTFKRTVNTEAITNMFKPPANPAPKRAYPPRGQYPIQQQWRRGRPVCNNRAMRGRMNQARQVYRTPNHQNANGMNPPI